MLMPQVGEAVVMIRQPMAYQSPPQGGYPPPPPSPMAPYQGGMAGAPAYAGFWIRVVAWLIDSVIVGIPIFIVLVILGTVIGGLNGAASSGSTSQQNAAAAVSGGVLIL